MANSALPLLVLVSGKPGSGKSTLARRLAEEHALWLPIVACDPIRNGIRETMLAGGRQAEATAGKQAIDLFYENIVFLLDRGISIIAELSLRRGLDEERVVSLTTRSRLRNVHCTVESHIARQRFLERQRLRTGANGVGTIGKAMIDGSFDWATFDPLVLPMARLLIDTTDGYDPTLQQITNFCRGE